MAEEIRPTALLVAPRAVLLRVAYVGTPFAGFARQPNRSTVAGELLQALQRLDPTVRAVRGASRTDAGVHALDQPVAFDAAGRVPLRGWVHGPRRWLPPTIVVREARAVEPSFDPRFAALEKTYRYLLHCGRTRDPFLIDRSWPLGELDPIALCERAAQELAAAQGRHSFTAFRSACDARVNCVRTIMEARARVLEPVFAPPWCLADRSSTASLVALEITGTAFLHNMVRILVGTAIDVARGRLAPGAVARALASGRRQDAGVTAPARGLYLARVRLGID